MIIKNAKCFKVYLFNKHILQKKSNAAIVYAERAYFTCIIMCIASNGNSKIEKKYFIGKSPNIGFTLRPLSGITKYIYDCYF